MSQQKTSNLSFKPLYMARVRILAQKAMQLSMEKPPVKQEDDYILVQSKCKNIPTKTTQQGDNFRS